MPEPVHIRQLMLLRKDILIAKAKNYKLSIKGTKYFLAKRIAEKECEDFSRVWKAISEGGEKDAKSKD